MSFAIPHVGSVITVTTYHNSNVFGRTVAEDTKTYEKALVIKPFGWTKPNAFCIPAENEPFIKVRTIPLSMITELVVHEGVDAEGCTSGMNFVYVPGSKGNEYMVTVVDGFGVECECLGYTYRGQCKHLKIASTETEAA